MQNKWASELNPLLNQPQNNGILLKNISLIAGQTIINHRLGKKQQGWIITDINAAATIYRSQPLNDKTLTLTSSAPCTVNLQVF